MVSGALKAASKPMNLPMTAYKDRYLKMFTPAKMHLISGTPDPSASLEIYSPTEQAIKVKEIVKKIQRA